MIQKNIIVVCGPPAIGKSTYGRKIALERNACIVDIDICTERMVKKALVLCGRDENDRDSLWFKEEFRNDIYEQMFDIARDQVQSVILIGPFTKECSDVEWVEKLKQRLGCPEVQIHYLTGSLETQKLRMIARGNPRDQGKLADWQTYVAYYKSQTKPVCPHILINVDE